MRIQWKLTLLIAIICTSLCNLQPVFAGDLPYPESSVIDSVTWHWDTHDRYALGSDIWPATWASDNNLYFSWGDGVGFGAEDWDEQWGPGRTSLGFSRVEGYPPDLTVANVWGGKDAENLATFDGKSPGMISVNGTLYAWINIENAENHWDYQLAWSSDLGATWHKESWKFQGGEGKFFPQAFLNFGKDYADARDDYVYYYGRTWGDDWFDGTSLEMGRVNKNKIKNRGAYEFFNGLDENGNPMWSTDINQRQPVFVDSNGCQTPRVIFHSVFNRYIMTNCHGSVREFGIFDAPEPWGPWTTVAYYDEWGGYGNGVPLFHEFPTKWISSDGKTMWCVYSSNVNYLDSFNIVKATLTFNTTLPSSPSNLRILEAK
jgi:hypothetical protein